jgi:diguanylate cyclase (GGDEF)-like protein/putative nucleotidyltransferase with HDIG domain/PAS domain S-box-containing protein
VAIVLADARGRITDVSAGAQRLFGRVGDDLRGRPLGSLCTLGAPSLLAAAASGAGAGPVDLVARMPDGRRVEVRYAVAALTDDDGAVTGYAMTAVDVSGDRARERRLEALRDVATAIAEGSGFEEVCATAAREAAALTGARSAGVTRRGAADDTATWSDPGTRVWSRDGAGAFSEPVSADGDDWGELWIGGTGAEGPGPRERAALSRIADLVGLAAGASRTREGEAADVLASLWRGDMDVERTIEMLAHAARGALGALSVTCFMSFDGEHVGQLVTTESAEPAVGHLRAGLGCRREQFALWNDVVAPSPAPLVEVRDAVGDRRIPPGDAVRLGLRGLVLRRLEHPLVTDAGVPLALGLLAFGWDRPHELSPRERIIIESVADLATLALASERRRRLKAGESAEGGSMRSDRDALTGLLSHTAFQDRLSAAVEEARREGRACALALLDIDHFRRINDGFGHAAGDRVLREVSRRLAAAARPRDILARVGGEEIAWLMDLPAVEALEVVDRAREALACLPVDAVGRVTVSAGLCDLGQAHTREDLVRFAEGALYWAKQHGRNVALVYAPEVVEVLSADERAERLARSQALQSIRVLARAVDAKDPSTLRHSERVADLAVAIATAMGWDSEALMRLREAGLVHDVGKIGVPDSILFKPDRLTRDEYREITRHAAIGAEILADVLLPSQVAWVRGHHERWDGGGYPDGLAGEAIPDGARVLALADAWDVMTSRRPYHSPLTVEAALIECDRCSGTQFAPEAVAALRGLIGSGAVPSCPDDADPPGPPGATPREASP